MRLGSALNMPDNSRSYEPDSSLVLPRKMIGLEVEVENADNNNRPNPGNEFYTFWEFVNDSSLRKGGIEAIFVEPMFGKDVIKAISLLQREAHKRNWESNYRTSDHLHLDMRDEEFDTLKNLCSIYAVLEKPLFDWAGEKREENVFCCPWQLGETDIDIIKSLFYSKDGSFIDKAARIRKYSALNIGALSKYGSIEFRHLKATFESNRILTWINFIFSMLKYAKETAKKGVSGYPLLERFSILGPEQFCHEIFGKNLSEELLQHATTLDWYDGVLIAQDLLRDDIVNQLGEVFTPINKILVPGTSKYFKKWEKNHRPKVQKRAFLDWGASLGALGKGPWGARGEHYGHPYKPSANTPGRWCPTNIDDDTAIGGITYTYMGSRPYDYITTHQYLSENWHSIVRANLGYDRYHVYYYTSRLGDTPLLIDPWGRGE